MSFEFVEHTGDAAVRIRARDAEELIQDAVTALLTLYVENVTELRDGRDVATRRTRAVGLEASDGEALLVDLLAELIWLFDSEAFLCVDIEDVDVSLGSPARLTAELVGETFDVERHVFRTEVKAATYHGLSIDSSADGLEAQVIFDL